MTDKLLSAVVVTGNNRRIAQTVVDALCAQTIARDMEIVIVDTAHRTQAPFTLNGQAKVLRVACDAEATWASARLAGVRQASTPIVAFLEDHCVPQADWAERLVEAHQGPWVAVGYSFCNANPQKYLSRAAMLSDYGQWEHPVESGPSLYLQSNNISYKRDALMSLGERLEWLLLSDGVIQEIFRLQKRPMYLESRARAAHHNFANFAELITENLAHSRIVGAVRAQVLGWSVWKRLVHGLATPFVAPCLRLNRMIGTVSKRPAQRQVLLVSFPIVFFSFLCSAIGESLGYLLGMGNSASQLTAGLLRQGID
jgi:hypothetical protein